MPDERIRITVSIPAWHYRILRLWGYFKGKGQTPMASDIIQARVEVNYDQIMQMLTSRAEDLGLTPEELKEMILSDGDSD